MSNEITQGTPNELAPFPMKGKPPGARLKDAAALQSIYWRMLQDDSLSAMQRYGIRQQINGAAPYATSTKKRAATFGGSNLNFGSAKSRIVRSTTVYNDMLDTLKAFIAAEIPINLYDDTTRQNAEDTVAEEWTVMIRDWNDFDPRFQLLAKEFIEHGVSLAHFPKDFDWRFDAAGLDNFLIPRDTRNSEEFVDILLQTKDEIPSALYQMIENEKAAEETGWNVDAVKRALVRATAFAGKRLPNRWGPEWGKLSQMIKGNDLQSSYSTNARVYLVHGWIREFDGSFSHYIAERDPAGSRDGVDNSADFLYKKISRFPPESNCFTIFCLNVGDGYYHSIRGQGYDQFPFVQTENKMLNDLVNQFRLGTTTMLKKSNANALDESPIVISNGMAIISPEVDYVEQGIQDHTRTTMPVMNFLGNKLDAVSPTIGAGSANPGSPVMTKYQLQAEQNTGSALNTSSVNMFNRSWKRLLREMFRRTQEIIKNERYDDFPEVKQFVIRCERRGITTEMILAVERVNEVRAIGAGSPGAQQATMDRMTQLMPTFDERGRAMFLHDSVTLLVGNRRAQRYMPLQDKPRPVLDQGFAQMENALMFGGGNIDPLDGQNHTIHAMVHMGGNDPGPDIASAIKTLEDWRNNGEQGDITELQPQIAFLALLIPHTERHVQAMASDPTRAELAASYRKALSDYSAMWMTYVRQLQKALDERASEAAQQEQPDPVEQAKIAKMQSEMEMSVRKFQTEQQLKVADVQTKIEIRKRESDVKMSIAINKANADRLAKMAVGEPMAAELPPASRSDFVTNRTARTPNV